MKKYYVEYFKSVVPCYLIKQGYLPCDKYDIFIKNGERMYYNEHIVDDFCIGHVADSENVFGNLKAAQKYCRIKIEADFDREIRSLINFRGGELDNLEEVEE